MIYEVEYEYDEGELPEERSVTACQLHAEMDLWASRYKLSYAAYDLACDLADYSYSHRAAVREKAIRWERAVEKIKAKYLSAENAYKQYLEKEFGQK
jgi:hypothetical protein